MTGRARQETVERFGPNPENRVGEEMGSFKDDRLQLLLLLSEIILYIAVPFLLLPLPLPLSLSLRRSVWSMFHPPCAISSRLYREL